MDIKEYTINIPANVAELVLTTRSHSEGVRCSNKGGIQSYFYHEHLDWMKPIVDQVKELFPEYNIYDGWFNVTGPGNLNRWHRHTVDQYSAVVYIQVPENSGDIEFQEGREFLKVQPVVGKVVGFSSNLMHRVLENQSNDFRISAAFNFIKI